LRERQCAGWGFGTVNGHERSHIKNFEKRRTNLPGTVLRRRE
jgi:hypothetical protein